MVIAWWYTTITSPINTHATFPRSIPIPFIGIRSTGLPMVMDGIPGMATVGTAGGLRMASALDMVMGALDLASASDMVAATGAVAVPVGEAGATGVAVTGADTIPIMASTPLEGISREAAQLGEVVLPVL